MLKVTILTKDGCSLCVKAKESLFEIRKDHPFEFEELDIARDSKLYELYKYAIPVVMINGKEAFRYNVSREKLKEILEGGKDE